MPPGAAAVCRRSWHRAACRRRTPATGRGAHRWCRARGSGRCWDVGVRRLPGLRSQSGPVAPLWHARRPRSSSAPRSAGAPSASPCTRPPSCPGPVPRAVRSQRLSETRIWKTSRSGLRTPAPLVADDRHPGLEPHPSAAGRSQRWNGRGAGGEVVARAKVRRAPAQKRCSWVAVGLNLLAESYPCWHSLAAETLRPARFPRMRIGWRSRCKPPFFAHEMPQAHPREADDGLCGS